LEEKILIKKNKKKSKENFQDFFFQEKILEIKTSKKFLKEKFSLKEKIFKISLEIKNQENYLRGKNLGNKTTKNFLKFSLKNKNKNKANKISEEKILEIYPLDFKKVPEIFLEKIKSLKKTM
jgi:hypothetical protein